MMEKPSDHLINATEFFCEEVPDRSVDASLRMGGAFFDDNVFIPVNIIN